MVNVQKLNFPFCFNNVMINVEIIWVEKDNPYFITLKLYFCAPDNIDTNFVLRLYVLFIYCFCFKSLENGYHSLQTFLWILNFRN